LELSDFGDLESPMSSDHGKMEVANYTKSGNCFIQCITCVLLLLNSPWMWSAKAGMGQIIVRK